MPKLSIDGKEIEVEEGTTVFEAARQHGISIPHFCYHPKLSIVGNCRMCLVDIEKSPKPQISCNTRAVEGMVVHTQTEQVKALQKNVLEFILINHPIDCPVCDQAGECKLQEFYMSYATSDSRFEEDKVKKPKKVDLGPNVMLDDERCILCSRCVRFCDEISHSGELSFSNRGDRSTLTTFPGRQLDNPYSLNTVDICPVGALTSKPFRFKKRVWLLKSGNSICTGCATGCNIFIDHDEGKVWRYRTRENEAVNQCWTCDAGRLSYTAINENRLIRPRLKVEGKSVETTEAAALEALEKALKQAGAQSLLLVGSALESNENNGALKKLALQLGISQIHYSSREVDAPFSDDFLIKADKNPNRAGVEHLGFTPWTREQSAAVVLALGEVSEQHLTVLRESEAYLILLSSHETEAVNQADVVLPTAFFSEQVGSFTNFQKRVQKFDKILEPRGQAKPAWEWLAQIAQLMGKTWQGIGPEALLRESFALAYGDLGKEGKVLS